jgi:galactose mutarotase-like enzyme
MLTIQNDQLIASINFKGAELSSLINLKDQTEYIWQADPIYWGRHAPILFPIVGRLKNDEYIFNNLTYSMSQHGFARDMEFSLVRQEASFASFSLKSSPQTMMVYPFKFELIVTYELMDSSIKIEYQVYNQDNKDLFFSIGGHPAFNCPLHSGAKRSDYQLVFEKEENCETQTLAEGLRAGKSQKLLHNQTTIQLEDDLFDHDALILSALNSTFVRLMRGNETCFKFCFEGFPYLGIWSKNQESPFVCIEPWYGIADTVNTNQRFEEKEGVIRLAMSEEFKCVYKVEL